MRSKRRPPASRPLRGRPGYRVRVGDYRILYTVQEDMLLVVGVALRATRRRGPPAAVPARRAGGGWRGRRGSGS
ncbi:MAG: type II toxin-antitoxin system RelE/ParE family toxin [Acidimicrobiaceae bacterium]|nr:type II toxin-antitoxin system RelE/ParE family toxin [Acidimicrobiaceae bacterium]